MDLHTLHAYGRLFRGRDDAWGTAKGAVVRGQLTEAHYAAHLRGEPPGLGIFPLLDDGRCFFAAVDLDEPNYEIAKQVRDLLPPNTYIELSRSGNYHIWAFFPDGIDAWIPRGLMREVLKAVGRPKAEIFPKQDRLLPGMVGNYINLPYYGDARRFVVPETGQSIPLEGPAGFLLYAQDSDPRRWQLRAERLGIRPAELVERDRQQGSRAAIHDCAVYIIRGCVTGIRPIMQGHRHIVLFNLAKMLLDWRDIDDDEAWENLAMVNNTLPDPLRPGELRRIFDNAKRGGYTSTGCDDPVMAPYVSPECRIAQQN